MGTRGHGAQGAKGIARSAWRMAQRAESSGQEAGGTVEPGGASREQNDAVVCLGVETQPMKNRLYGTV